MKGETKYNSVVAIKAKAGHHRSESERNNLLVNSGNPQIRSTKGLQTFHHTRIFAFATVSLSWGY